MGEKKGKPQEGADNKKNENGGGKNSVTVVLKADLHCEGCISKVMKCIRSFHGVDTATIGGEQKITVVGKVDPVKLRDRVEQKTHKRVELVSPQPKKDSNNNNRENSGGDNAKQEKKKESKNTNSKDKSDDKKLKEKQLPVTTAVMKVHLHCEGCTQKIYKAVRKTKGYQDMKVDKQKDLVTVTGAMDMTALAQVLRKHLKKDVEILPPKKDAEKKENSGGEKQKKSWNEKGKNEGDKGKSGGGGGVKNGDEMVGGGGKMEANGAQFQVGYPYTCGPGMVGEQFYYNPSAVGPYHAPQLFSDENPNACRVM